MSSDEEKQSALVVALTKAGTHSLAVRGRDILRRKEEAAECLRKGLELRDTAPNDPFGLQGPINPYATRPEDSSAQILKAAEYVEQIEAGTSPDIVAKNLRMMPEDEEFGTHVPSSSRTHWRKLHKRQRNGRRWSSRSVQTC